MESHRTPDATYRWWRIARKRLRGIWGKILRRCDNPKQDGFERYGGRGIRVCSEWRTFAPFFNWAILNGYANDLEIDRENNDGHYEPSNCRWVTRSVNQQNKRNSSPPRSKTSRFKGVRLGGSGRNPWRAEIRTGGKLRSLGLFPTQEMAARAYDAAAVQHYGEKAFTNFPAAV